MTYKQFISSVHLPFQILSFNHLSNFTHSLMAKRRITRPKGQNNISEQEHATSPLMDVEPNTTLAVNPAAKPRPKPRPKPARKQLTPDAVDDPQQHSKRGRSRSDADENGPAFIVQPPAKKTKTSNTILPVQHGSNSGDSRSKVPPPRSPLPLRINRVVNPGAPDKKRKKCTSAEVTAAAEQKKRLLLELERIERDKIRMLAEMEAVEEEEQQDDESKVIKNMADLAEFQANKESDTKKDKEGWVRGNDSDIVMADDSNYRPEEVDSAFVEDDNKSDSDFEGREKVKMVSEIDPDSETWLLTVGVLFNRRGRPLGQGGTFERRLTRRKESLVRKQGGSFSIVFVIMIFSRLGIIDGSAVPNLNQVTT